MKTIIKYGFMLSFLAATGTGCSENDIALYEDTPAVYIEMLGADGTSIRDSLVFSFPVVEDQTHQIDVRVRLLGFAADRDRKIDIGIDTENSTAAAGTNYDIPASVTLPANAYETTIPVTVKRTGLKDKAVRLVVALQPNEEFVLGFKRGHEAILMWGDKYIKPDNWDSSFYKDFFGEFSERKYGAILEALEMQELPPPLVSSYTTFGYYNRKVRAFLSDNPRYEEDGSPITIPVNNGGQGGLG